MGGYYYINDPKSDLGYDPIPEDDFVAALFSIAKKHGLKITDKMILDEVYKKKTKSKKVKNKKMSPNRRSGA